MLFSSLSLSLTVHHPNRWQREAREKADIEAKANAEREAREKADIEAKDKAERDAREKTDIEAKSEVDI